MFISIFKQGEILTSKPAIVSDDDAAAARLDEKIKQKESQRRSTQRVEELLAAKEKADREREARDLAEVHHLPDQRRQRALDKRRHICGGEADPVLRLHGRHRLEEAGGTVAVPEGRAQGEKRGEAGRGRVGVGAVHEGHALAAER